MVCTADGSGFQSGNETVGIDVNMARVGNSTTYNGTVPTSARADGGNGMMVSVAAGAIGTSSMGMRRTRKA